MLGVVGIALLWRQADEAQRERWLDSTGRIDPMRVVFGDGGWASYARIAAGIGLIVLALVLFSAQRRLGRAWPATSPSPRCSPCCGLAIVVGPWVYRLASDLSDERAERVRTQERADVAAHLHDSVLQTLALIQKNADDGATVARLARAQERDLRAWLYAGESTDERTVASALRGAAARIEDEYGVVRRRRHRRRLRPRRGAAPDRARRPARRSPTPPSTPAPARSTSTPRSPTARSTSSCATAARGFDLDAVPTDRHGVRSSIIDRMQRHGGSAEVRSAPGEGTEVRLHLARQPRQEENDD